MEKCTGPNGPAAEEREQALAREIRVKDALILGSFSITASLLMRWLDVMGIVSAMTCSMTLLPGRLSCVSEC